MTSDATVRGNDSLLRQGGPRRWPILPAGVTISTIATVVGAAIGPATMIGGRVNPHRRDRVFPSNGHASDLSWRPILEWPRELKRGVARRSGRPEQAGESSLMARAEWNRLAQFVCRIFLFPVAANRSKLHHRFCGDCFSWNRSCVVQRLRLHCFLPRWMSPRPARRSLR